MKKKTTKEKYSLSSSRVDRIVSQFPKRKVLVFGDVGIDKYTVGKVSRISPEAPIPIVEVTETHFKLGLASNVADNIAALGGKALLVGAIGRDIAANDFVALLKKNRISDRYLVVDRDRKTTLKERVVAESQQVVRIDHETQRKPDVRVIRQTWEKLELSLRDADAIVVEDYAKGLVEESLFQQLIRAAAERKIPVFVDPNKGSPASLYLGCTVITPNTNEAEVISGVNIHDSASLRQAGQRILDEVNAQIAIITRGKDGMAVFVRGEPQPMMFPTFAREVFDVSGAGDTVIATLALSMASGANITEAVLLANFAAGVEVGKRGTATVTVSELKDYIGLVGDKRVQRTNASV